MRLTSGIIIWSNESGFLFITGNFHSTIIIVFTFLCRKTSNYHHLILQISLTFLCRVCLNWLKIYDNHYLTLPSQIDWKRLIWIFSYISTLSHQTIVDNNYVHTPSPTIFWYFDYHILTAAVEAILVIRRSTSSLPGIPRWSPSLCPWWAP